MMKIRGAVLLVLLATTIATAGEQTTAIAPERLEEIENRLTMEGIRPEAAESAIHTMIRAGFTAEQMSLVAERMTAGDDQFPVAEPILAKIHEGAVKGAKPAAILTAVENVRNRYLFSARLAAELGQPGERQLVAYLADCLAAGLSRHEAEEISAALRTRTRTVNEAETRALTIQTILTARTMVRQGVTTVTAAEVLVDALAQGYDNQGMLALRRALDQSGSGSLENTARRFGTAIRQGARAGELQDSSGLDQGTSARSGSKNAVGDAGNAGDGNAGNGNSGGSNDSGGGKGEEGSDGGNGSGSGNDSSNGNGKGGRF